MMKKMIALLLVILAVLGSVAVAQEEENLPFTVYPPVKAYAVFEFEGNPSTGFSWTAFPIRDGVVEISEGEYKVHESDEALVGQGGIYTFKVTAASVGETIVLFHYTRPWETEEITTKAYLVNVLEDGTMDIRDLEGFAPLFGTVVSVDAENGSVLLNTDTHGEVIARFPEDMQLPTVEENVKIWFNGVMTMSLPGQINVIGWETVAPSKARVL